MDRDLYLPKAWTDDAVRCQQAGIPKDRKFLTKNQMAGLMYERIIKAGYKPAYEVYGKDSKFRNLLESHNQPYVLCVACDQIIDFGITKTKMSEYVARFRERE